MPKPRNAVPTPRAWRSPTLVLGPVSVKVGLKSLDAEEKIHAKTLCPCHLVPGHQAYACSVTGEIVEPVKRYEVGDTYVELDPADYKSDADYTMYLEAAPPTDEIDPAFFGKSYLIWPEHGYGQQFDMLAGAIAKTGASLVGTCVLNGRTEVFAVRFSKHFGTLVAQKLILGEDLDVGSVGLVNEAAEARELHESHDEFVDLLATLIGTLQPEYDPFAYTNDYRDRMRAALEAAANGTPIPRPVEKAAPKPPADLMKALRESVAAASKAKRPAAKKPATATRKPAAKKPAGRKKVAR